MREMTNCLNVLLVLLALPFYLLMMVAGLVGMVVLAFSPAFSLSPDRLPEWLRLIATPTFVIVAVLLNCWYVLATTLGSQRIHADMVFFDTILEDGISGYLLFAGLVVAAVVLKLVVF